MVCNGTHIFLGFFFVFFWDFFSRLASFCWLLLASGGFWLLAFVSLLAFGGFWLLAFVSLLAFGFWLLFLCWPLVASLGFWLLVAFGFCFFFSRLGIRYLCWLLVASGSFC